MIGIENKEPDVRTLSIYQLRCHLMCHLNSWYSSCGVNIGRSVRSTLLEHAFSLLPEEEGDPFNYEPESLVKEIRRRSKKESENTSIQLVLIEDMEDDCVIEALTDLTLARLLCLALRDWYRQDCKNHESREWLYWDIRVVDTILLTFHETRPDLHFSWELLVQEAKDRKSIKSKIQSCVRFGLLPD